MISLESVLWRLSGDVGQFRIGEMPAVAVFNSTQEWQKR